MRNLRVKLRIAMSLASPLDCMPPGELYVSNIRVSHVAESLFRLSLCVARIVTPLPFPVLERGVFGSTESGFRDFVLNHWEVSPFLVKRMAAGAKIEEDDLFGPLSANLVGTYPSFLSSMLPGMVSCLPIASDELNILAFLEEVQNKLGCPLVYQQDIRVVKTKSKKEVHFFANSLASCCVNDPHCLSTEDVLKCEEAYKEGYTVALRGMEFRFGSVAAIAEGLASIFGQPSVGCKKWRVSSQSNVQLPRLYDPLDRLYGSEVHNSMDNCKQYLLREGDILYIPRGVLHEACTENVSLDGSASCSLHITLGIEVEPPFEWEGFVHVAFFSWYQIQKHVDNSFESSIHVISANLFHAAIGLIGGSDPTFRKACLIASIFPRSHAHNWLDLGQRMIFRQLIDKIGTESRFLEVFRSIELAVQENKDPLQRIKWLDFLNMEKERRPNHDQNMPFMEMRNLLSLCVQHRDLVEAAFHQLKSRFCENVIVEDAIVSYKMLLDKYRNVRKQYMNGMVSLHHQL
ncbi:PREDICTED: uncharacterized protein LOC101300921 [Fragaria vesca subsp. vesca]